MLDWAKEAVDRLWRTLTSMDVDGTQNIDDEITL